MKKAALKLLCFSLISGALLTTGAVTAYAEQSVTKEGSTAVNTTVPRSHKVTVELEGNGTYTLDGKTGAVFEVERLSQPELVITPETGSVIVTVTLNGEHIEQLVSPDGKYTLDPVYEDKYIYIKIHTPYIEPDDSSEPPHLPPLYPGGPSDGGPSGGSGGTDGAPPDTTPSPEPEPSPAPEPEPAPAPEPAPSDNDNPSTGVLGGVSFGSAVLLTALIVVRKREKDSENKE